MPIIICNRIATTALATTLIGAVTGCSNPNAPTPTESRGNGEAAVWVVVPSEIEWGRLNPARGDASPRAGALWGVRTSPSASGFLVEFAEGFSSPPHIHNVSYRGIVIGGLVHNDDPGATAMWMPAGSFWTQPAGEAHVTAASGERNLAYIEIEDGPYLVHPVDQAFDNGERPVNIVSRNMVWQNASAIAAGALDEVKAALLWGSPGLGLSCGLMFRIPANFDGVLRINSEHQVVVIESHPMRTNLDGTNGQSLPPGSAFGSDQGAGHHIATASDESTVLYVRTDGAIQINETSSRSNHE